MKTIRVLIAEDQPTTGTTLTNVLSNEQDLEMWIAEGEDAAAVAHQARRRQPDVVLLDLTAPHFGGGAATRLILRDCPGARVMIRAAVDDDAIDSLCAGAQAFLSREASDNDVLDAIRAVARGEFVLGSNVARKAIGELRRLRESRRRGDGLDQRSAEALTERENDILRLIVAGKGNKEIAGALRLAEGTVKNYVSRILEKLNARSRTELAVKTLNRRLD